MKTVWLPFNGGVLCACGRIYLTEGAALGCHHRPVPVVPGREAAMRPSVAPAGGPGRPGFPVAVAVIVAAAAGVVLAVVSAAAVATTGPECVTVCPSPYGPPAASGGPR